MTTEISILTTLLYTATNASASGTTPHTSPFAANVVPTASSDTEKLNRMGATGGSDDIRRRSPNEPIHDDSDSHPFYPGPFLDEEEDEEDGQGSPFEWVEISEEELAGLDENLWEVEIITEGEEFDLDEIITNKQDSGIFLDISA